MEERKFPQPAIVKPIETPDFIVNTCLPSHPNFSLSFSLSLATEGLQANVQGPAEVTPA